MSKVSQLNNQVISRLAGFYMHAKFYLDTEPITATEKEKRKIKKWVKKQYNDVICELPDEMRQADILSLSKECFDFQNAIQKEKQEQFDRDFSAFDEEIKSALNHLLNFEFWSGIRRVGTDVEIIVSENSAYRRTITLKNVGSVIDEKEGYNCSELEFKKDGDKFCFCGKLVDPIEETSEPFNMTFDDAETEVKSYNACNCAMWENPWYFLQEICYDICLKADLAGNHYNDEEKELLPLMREIASLEHYVDPDEQGTLSFREFKKEIARLGYEKFLDFPNELATKNRHKVLRKRIKLLCQKRFEPLWRAIYDKIAHSQSEYPNKVEALFDSKLLTNTRDEIQKLMESHGYIGTYPEFVKDAVMKGVHLEHSYGSTYFVGKGKRVQYHVRCCEELSDEGSGFTIQFICGTAFLENGEDEPDVFGCLFNAKGRRLYNVVHHYVPAHSTDEKDDLETSVSIAVKKAECIKLDKDEKKAFYGIHIAGAKSFWLILLIAGGLFSVLMTAAMMIVCVVVTLIFSLFLGQWIPILEMLRTIPWGWILAFGWIAFGGTMGIIETLSQRK